MGTQTNYRKIKIGASTIVAKQWVAKCHTDVLIKIKIGSPLLKKNYSTSCHIKIERLITKKWTLNHEQQL